MLRSIYKKLGPLGPILVLFLCCLSLFALNRVFLGLNYSANFSETNDYLFFLPVGVRTDIIILCLTLALPTLLMLVLPAKLLYYFKPLLAAYFTFICCLFLFFEIVSWPFMDQYSSRPNQLFFQYFTHPKEVLGMVWAEYKLLLVASAIAIFLFAKYCWRFFYLLVEKAHNWKYWQNIIALPLVIALMTIGARSGIGQANANPSVAAFSNDHLVNQVALNASYSLSFAIYTAKNAAIRSQELYGDMPTEEVVSRIKNYMDAKPEDFVDENIPTLHKQTPTIKRDKPANLVVIVMEGLGSEYIGSLDGIDLTPNFDKLSKEGALFSQVHATGTRTSRGMEAMVSGYPPTSKSSSIMKLDLAQRNFFTIASLLKQHGYSSNFIYGGEAHFDNMASFFLGNCFDEIIDENDFENPEYYGTWGVSDEDIFVKANEKFRNNGDEPFLSVILTVSNHIPFDFPDNKIELYVEEKATPLNSAKYSDFALGRFFDMAKKEDYFSNTVFLITGDHPMKVRGDHLVPINKYKVPGLIIAPGLEAKRIDTIASQIDLLPTAVGLLGMETVHPMIGRNLLNESNLPGKNISIYAHSLAFRVNNQAVIYQPHKPPQSYTLDENEKLHIAEQNLELEKDALAFILFPGIAYANQLYQLPQTNQASYVQ